MRCGTLGTLPTLDECHTSSTLGREWGVDKPSAKSVRGKSIDMACGQLKYGNMILNLYRHPRLLIPKNIEIWEKEYNYTGDYYGVVPYLDRHPCAIEAREIYDNAKALFKAQ